ncbi:MULTISPECIES: 4a-hydroxytetrahydrobiopterin dehydratase [Rhodomicrobium]|uniref:4a-hydroxytetrahydrobiopterin dehydratase n=1 Tax=Rhodomicrobium TaxID=1068 RepID=UPI000B4BFD68|nr:MULTISPECIES: 4a-hydroxytetrahydrobiopterin dehydratase [Rhodomicrobium]
MPGRADETVYTPDEIAERLEDMPDWRFENGHIVRNWKTRNWPDTLMLINAIGYLAEIAWHHPEISASYGALKVRLMTHSAHGITAKDFELAAKIEAVAGWNPAAEGGALEGRPKPKR